MSETPAEALRRRSKALTVIVGYPQSGWSVSTRTGPSGPLLTVSGHSLDDCCVKLMGVLDGKPPPSVAEQRTESKRKLRLKMKL